MNTIGITMGCPAGIGPEIIFRYFQQLPPRPLCETIVLGDVSVLEKCRTDLDFTIPVVSWQPGTPLPEGAIPVVPLSSLSADAVEWGKPTLATAHDVLAVLGFFHLMGKEINLILVSSLLMIAGYSLTDTVVVFDRIRENMRGRIKGKINDGQE